MDCRRCGESVGLFSPSLVTVALLQKAVRENHLSMLVTLEGVSPDVAAEWLHHRYYCECIKKVAHCAFCGAELRTWRARQCLACKRQWLE